MRTMGFITSTKKNEKRIALLPEHIEKIKNKGNLYFEKGYGELLGHMDEEYIAKGANVVKQKEVLSKDIICDPKIGDSDYLSDFKEKQTIFGYIHAMQNADIKDKIVNNSMTAIAWEDMNEDGRHVFWRNNELAGEAAIMHAFTLYGRMPYECKVAVIGRGNTARGACRILSSLGAEVRAYDRKMEGLIRYEIADYDVIVNSVTWDISRNDHIIYKEDLKRMKKNSMIIDVSCDKCGSIESSIPTTMEAPTYLTDGVLHYVVDHTPSLMYYTASRAFGDVLVNYTDGMIEDEEYSDETIKKAVIIKDGIVLVKE